MRITLAMKTRTCPALRGSGNARPYPGVGSGVRRAGLRSFVLRPCLATLQRGD